MGCCGSTEEEPERRHLLGPDGHPARDRTRHASEQIPAGQREGHSTREVPQTPIDTSNYEQRVLDNIVQTAVKDFIDISQQTDMQEGSYDGSKEKLEMYMEKVSATQAQLADLPLGKPTNINFVSQRELSQQEYDFLDASTERLEQSFGAMNVEDKGGLVVAFSASLSASGASYSPKRSIP